ncbi:MurR/RpiR family transcriptional regulator [Variovorax sp. V59]
MPPAIAAGPYASAEDFLQAVRAGFEGLSRQLKLIARYVETSRDRLALDGVQETASECGVQPSAVVRFAKHFGFSGFSEMQALFRAGAAQRLAPHRDYQERIRSLVGGAGAAPITPARIAHEVIGGSIESLQALQAGLPDERFDAAVELMLDAPALWLAASRRAFPVGAYLAYALQHTAKPVHWLHGLGHMQQGELRALAPGDVLVAISFEPYAQETLDVVELALAQGARLLAITDSQLSPLAGRASAVLLAQDGATFGFRSLTSTLCLAQSLFLGLAYRMELAYERRGT